MRNHGRGLFVLVCLAGFLFVQAGAALGQSEDAEWEPITEERLLDPQDGDWMSYRRTYDASLAPRVHRHRHGIIAAPPPPRVID